MQNAQAVYAQSINEVVELILAIGHQQSVLISGDIGIGKTTTLDMLSERLPTHWPVYFDGTTKDIGDMFIPRISDAETGSYVSFVPNEEFGIHHGQPVILMIDEIGKANPSVQNALIRTLQERTVGSTPLPEGSIVFATTNLAAEGVGDRLKLHQYNRVTEVRMRKPTNMEWIEWGVDNGVHPTVLGWARETPAAFQSFTEVEGPEDNEYILHPRAAGRTAGVTPRSLFAASRIVSAGLPAGTTTAALVGTIGPKAALELMAFIKLAEQLPRRDDIINDPMTAKIPDNVSAVCMVVFRALSGMDNVFVGPWMDYLTRLDALAQGIFVNGVRAKGYKHRDTVMKNKKFTDWSRANSHLFSVDKA